MIKQYIKQALRTIGKNKLLSVISILGTALAICMIMVIVILYVVNTASFKPEVNRGRTCYITTVMSNGKDDNRRISYSSLGLPLVKECCYPLKGAEAVTAINMDRYRPLTASSMDGLKNRTSYISYTDTAFWKVFQFDFLGHGHTVLGDEGGAEFLVDHHVAAGRAQRAFNSLGDLFHAAEQRLASGFIKLDLFSHNIRFLKMCVNK